MKTKSSYKSNKTWHEDNINEFEYELEKELNYDKKQMEIEKEEFENKINQSYEFGNEYLNEKTGIELLTDAIINNNASNGFTRLKGVKTTMNNLEYNFRLPRNVDVINKVYLCIKINDDELGINENIKNAILNSYIMFSVSDTYTDRIKISNALLQQIFTGDNIKEDTENNELQIPIYNFNYIKLNENLNGLPVVSLVYSDVVFIIKCLEDIQNTKLSLLIESSVLPNKLRSQISINKYIIMSLTTNIANNYNRQIDEIPLNTNYIDNIAKYIMLSFYRYNDEDKINLQDIDIEFARINFQWKKEYNTSEDNYIEWESEEILTCDLWGNRVYLLPLSSDLSSWEKVNNTFTQPNVIESIDKTGLDFNKIKDLKLSIKTYSPYFYDTYFMVQVCGFKSRCIGCGTMQ
jgi:hypothetical protein